MLQSLQQCLKETEKKHIRNLYGITEIDNSLLELDFICIGMIVNLADSIYSCIFGFRNTPLEALHTFQRGAYKYFLMDVMGCLSKCKRSEIAACITAFNFSGFSTGCHVI